MRQCDRVTYPRGVARESSPPILARSFMPSSNHAGDFLEAKSGGISQEPSRKSCELTQGTGPLRPIPGGRKAERERASSQELVESSLQNRSSRFGWLRLVPPHPPLSLREREQRIPRREESRRSGLAQARRTILPLPQGEGRGEGEATLETPMRLTAYAAGCWRVSGDLFLGDTGLSVA